MGDVAGGGELVGGGGAEGRHDFPATQAACQPFPLADFSVLIRSDCVVTISALPKESFRSPALQNGALLHRRSLTECMGFAVRLSASCTPGNMSVETHLHITGRAARLWLLRQVEGRST